jgi:phosphoenolpyruvate synthase/pyruvate phosphate dikinase
MEQTKKFKWFKIEEIPKCNYFMLVPFFEKYGTYIEKKGGGPYFKNLLWVINEGTITLCYLRDDFTKGINFLLAKTVQDPRWAEKRNLEIVKYTKKYFSFAKSLENKDFSALSDEQLVGVFNQLINHQYWSHLSGQITTWLLEDDRHLFSNYLLDLLKEKVWSGQKLSETFSILTTPEKLSLIEIESKESIELAKLLRKDQKAKNLFLKNSVDEIKKNLNKINYSLQQKIKRHYQKYLWLHYNYEGPVLELEYFLEIWRGLLKQNNIEELIKEGKSNFTEIKEKRVKIFKELDFSEKEKKFFDVARDIVWLKSWRKDCMYYGAYVLDKIAKEIGRRLGLSLRQVRFFCYWEVKGALLKDKYDVDKLNERYNFSLVYTDSVHRPVVYSGQAARKFLDRCTFIEQKIKKVEKLFGVCASPGKAKGYVSIIETVDDLKKMKKGNVMLSETTYPSLVPAMKLSSAIVTNVGGLTCHAAIVSRELKKPCVVGTKIATKVLCDGDLVEVDADRGVVKKLK